MWWADYLPLRGERHWPMLVVGVFATVFVGWLCRMVCRHVRPRRIYLLLASMALLAMQIETVHSYYFYTNWDVQQVTGAAQAMATGEPTAGFRWYFDNYPNNLFITRLFALVFWLSGPIFGTEVHYFLLLVVQCVASWLAGLMLFQIAKHMWQSNTCALFAWVLYCLLVAVSPWWSIPYSDVWGLVVIVSVIWLSTAAPTERRGLVIVLVAALSVVGYYIKPQTVFVLFSAVILMICTNDLKARTLRTYIRPACHALLGVAAGLIIVYASTVGSGMRMHSEKNMGAAHYLMIGANQQTLGMYSDSDLDFSRSFSDNSQRRKAQLRKVAERYDAMGAWKSATFWSRKTLMNFSDGTFSWGHEGNFFREIPPRQGVVASSARKVYYAPSLGGSLNVAYSVAATAVWFAVLLLSVFAVVPIFRRKSGKSAADSRVAAALMLSVVCIVLFHALFECRARYLFCQTPVFILLAVQGAASLCACARDLLPKLSGRRGGSERKTTV